jgi:uncharacterized membrane protein
VLFLPGVHPFLVHYPIALFSFALLCDLALVIRFRLAWLDRAALLCYAAAALASLAAALSGKISADRLLPAVDVEAATLMGSHGDWAFLTVVLLVAVLAARIEAHLRDRGREAPSPHRIRLAALALALFAGFSLFMTASRGGELVYRFGVGVGGPRLERR